MPSSKLASPPDWHVSGHTLKDFRQDQHKIFQVGAISLSPSDAIKRIRQVHGIDGDISVSAMQDLNKVINLAAHFVATSSNLSKTPEKILVLAPHSHWGDNLIITTTYDPDNKHFLIGRNEILPDSLYYPVSFVFFEGNADPFEWLRGGDVIQEPLIREFWALIEILSPFIDSRIHAVGIGFDYRNAVVVDSIISPTIELNWDDERGVILSSLAFELSHGPEELKASESVAWPLLAQHMRGKLEGPSVQIMDKVSSLLENAIGEIERNHLLKAILESLD
jgi:hypothetical protein